MSRHPLQGASCPYSGMPLRRDREWTDVPLTPRYAGTFALIGDRILYSAPRGNAGTVGMPRFLALRERVLREVGLWDAPHVEIKCYDEASFNHPPVARQQFAEAVLEEARRGQLQGLWTFGGPLMIRWILRVTRQHVAGSQTPIPASYVRDYQAALLAATRRLEALGLRAHAWTLRGPKDWQLEYGASSVRYRLVAKDVLHVEVRGAASEATIRGDAELQSQILKELDLQPGRPYFQIRDVRGAPPPSPALRRLWLQLQDASGLRFPCGGVVLFGLPDLGERLSMRLTGWRSGTPLVAVGSYAEAIEAITQLRRRHNPRPRGGLLASVRGALKKWPLPRFYSQRRLDRYVGELLAHAINWDLDNEDIMPSGALSEGNPLELAHAAIAVLKSDLGEVLARSERAQGQLLRASKMASLGTLSAGLAHELNSPLTSVSGYAQRLARSDDPGVRQQAAAILRSTGRIRSIINQLDRRPGGVKERVDLGGLIRDAAAILELEFGRHEITLTLDLPTTPALVVGRPTELSSVLVNLLTNACHALADLEPGAPREVQLQLRRRERYLELICEDSGPGMSAEIRQRAVDPFFTTKPVGRGTGLGLFISHRIVEEHGGVLHLPECERGCRVEVRLEAF